VPDPASHVPEPRKPSWWERLRDKLATSPSTGLTIVIGVAVIFAAGLVGSAAGYLVSRIGAATREVPFYAFVGGGVGLILGLLAAWFGTRLYYQLVESKRKLEFEAMQQHVARLGAARENLRRLDLYSDHIYGILEAFISEEMSLHDPSSEDAASAICGAPADFIFEATGHRVSVSIWAEPRDANQREAGEGIIGRATEFVRDNISDKVADPVKNAILGKFQIVAGATTAERKAFAVRVASSWLKHHHEKEDDEPASISERGNESAANNGAELPRRSQDLDRFVYRADAPFHGLDDRDIKAFRELKYRTVRAISFRRAASIYYVVMLAKTDGVFTEAEDLYLLWLKRVLELDRAIYHIALAPGGHEALD
jgi:hypothetical protein